MSNDKETRVLRLAKEGSWIIVGQVVTISGSLAAVRVLTEYLSPAQYGQLALGLTLVGLVNQVAMGGIGNAICRYYSIAVEKQDLIGYFNASSRLLLYATGFVILFSLPFMAGLFSLRLYEWLGLTVAALLFSILGGYNCAINSIQNAARQRAIVAFHAGLDSWLKIGIAVIMIYWLGKSSTAVVIGYTCSLIIITISQFIFLNRFGLETNNICHKENQWLRHMYLYSLPFSTWGVFTWLQLSSDRWSLQAFGSANDVGQYSVLFQLGYTPVVIATGLFVNFLEPILFQQSGDATDPNRNANVHRISWQLTQVALVITLVGFSIAFLLHEWLFRWLVASQYREGSYLLPWVLLAGGFFAAGQMLALKIMSDLNPSAMTAVKITTALGGLIFNVIGASLYGINGVVAALILFSACYFFWMAIITQSMSIKIFRNK